MLTFEKKWLRDMMSTIVIVDYYYYDDVVVVSIRTDENRCKIICIYNHKDSFSQKVFIRCKVSNIY